MVLRALHISSFPSSACSAVQGISGAAAINEQPDGVIQIYATTAVYLIRLFNFLHDQYTAAIDDSSVCIAKNDSIYK